MKPWSIRNGVDTDLEMVLSAWLKTAFNLTPHKDVDWNVYNDDVNAYRTKVIRLLQVDKVFFAHDPTEPNVTYGWVAFRETSPNHIVIDYVYVKAMWRRQGICRDLIDYALHTASDPQRPIQVTVSQKAKESVDQALHHTLRSLVGTVPVFNPYVQVDL